MRSLLNFIVRYHYFILFILIECFSLLLVVQNNDYHLASFLNSSSKISGKVYSARNSVLQYIDLKNANKELNETLANYKNQSKTSYRNTQARTIDLHDSIYMQQYQYIPAQVINNSINKQNNYLTLNVGRNQGVEKEMAVISPLGIVGVVKDVSGNFASVISVLNQHLKISAMVKNSGYFGSLNWEGGNYRYAILTDLPNHIILNFGDTIITSGYSSMFPKGEVVGFVEKVNTGKGSNLMTVTVRLAVDFNKITHVMVVKNLLREEQLNLENNIGHD